MKHTDFYEEVFNVVNQIPCGKVLTYGKIAYLLGYPKHARMVGHAMSYASKELPCYRVVNSQGRLAPGWKEQRHLLEQEGVVFRKNGCVNLKVSLWEVITNH